MGHEEGGFTGGRPELEQLLVQVIAHNFVQRAKGFIHQKQIRIEGERAGD